MPERPTTAAQLARILYVLPAAARKGGVRLDDLAATLDVSVAQVVRDIQEVTTRAYYHPAGPGDALQIQIEHDKVEVWTTADFRRPVRLSAREALALGVALRALAAQIDAARRAELLALATRLETMLAAPAERLVVQADASPSAAPWSASETVAEPRRPIRRAGPPVAPPSPPAALGLALAGEDGTDVLGVLADAAREHRICEITYLKPGAAAPEARRIAPYRLAYAEGRWYVPAGAAGLDALRVFRVDRILDARALEERFEPPPDLDLTRYIAPGGAFFYADDDIEVTVRYSPRIARWLAERLPHERRPDGSIVARHRVADTRWLIRHVLQYGADAEVLEPAGIRARTAAAAERLLTS